MVNFNRVFLALAALTSLAAAKPADSPSEAPHPSVIAAGAVLLKDWAPESSLVVPKTEVPRARFPVIDVHSHVYTKDPAKIAQWVRTMDDAGVQTTVILTGVVGAAFDELVDLYLTPYPKRFQLYAGVDTRDFEAPDYPERAAAELERCYRKGARGVGELTDKGSGYAGGALPRDRRLHPDDPRLDLFWRKVAALKIPANIHMADHPSVWRPLDGRQERSPRYQIYNQHGKDVPSYEELLQIRDRLLARHRKTIFIACHLSNQGNDLASLAKVIDHHPNLYIDLSARAYEVGRQPRAAAKFISKYRDRILFGTDQDPDKEMYLRYWRLFESADEYMVGGNWWRLYGLDLAAPVLKAIYRDNAVRIMNWQRP